MMSFPGNLFNSVYSHTDKMRSNCTGTLPYHDELGRFLVALSSVQVSVCEFSKSTNPFYMRLLYGAVSLAAEVTGCTVPRELRASVQQPRTCTVCTYQGMDHDARVQKVRVGHQTAKACDDLPSPRPDDRYCRRVSLQLSLRL